MLKRLLFCIPVGLLGCVTIFFSKVLFDHYVSGAEEYRILDAMIVSQPLPDLDVEYLHQPEQHTSLRALDGQPWLLNIWATWCVNCYAEHQFLKDLSEDGIAIVGLNYKDERPNASDWLQRFGDPFHVNLFDPKGSVGIELGAYGAPETYFINAQGLVVYRHVGEINAQIWQEKLRAIYEGLQS